MERIIKKKAVFLSWVLSYAFVAIMPILIGSIVYIASVKTVREEVNKVNNMSLVQLKSVLDGKFEELNRTVSNIALNQDVQTLMYRKDPLMAKDILTIREVQKDLTKFKLSNGYIDEIYIYINNNDFIFSSSYKYNSDAIADICQREFLLSYDELTEMFHAKNYKYFRILENDTGNGMAQHKVILLHSLYLNDLNDPTGTLIISIDESKLNYLLKNLELTNQGEVILVNSKNEFYGTGEPETLQGLFSYDSLKEKNNVFYEKIMDQNAAVTHVLSDTLDLEYASLIPTYIFLDKVQYIKSIIGIYIIVCLITGIIAAFFLAKKNYSPVEKLKQMVINRLGESENEERNEFIFLENSLKDLLDENDCIAAKLKQQKAAKLNNLFVKLLKGRAGSLESMKASLASYGIKFGSDCFLVTAFCIEDLNGKHFGDVINHEDKINLIYFIVKNIVEEQLNEKYLSYMAEIDDMIVFLVNTEKKEQEVDTDALKNNIVGILNKTLSFIESKFEILLSAAVSDIHYGLQSIPHAYSEILEVFEYKTLFGEQDLIIRYDLIHSDIMDDINHSYCLEKEILFANCIKSGDYKNAKEILNDLIAKSLKKNIKSMQLAKCRVFGLINTTLNAIDEIKPELDMEFFDRLDPANRLLNTKSISELKIQVDDIFNRIIEYSTNKERVHMPDWIADVESYIKRHYQEADLSIASISEHMGISVSYLSRTYKKYWGIGLLDYIHKIRIEKAKKLMNADMNLNDIALQLGYLESKALIRSFKRYEGITPGRFRATLADKAVF